MPWKPACPCHWPGCRELVLGRYCEAHEGEVRRQADQQRGSAAARGYGRKWQAARADFIRRNPVCVACAGRGLVAAAEVVDHVVPHRGDQRLFWSRSNWQALCKPCHDVKTAREDGGFGRGGAASSRSAAGAAAATAEGEGGSKL
jgi:5-methylcytosine-specific restriction protein A